MVGTHGEVYVLDWGLAKVVGRPSLEPEQQAGEDQVSTHRSEGGSMQTRVGGVLGTPAYMPPEQARGEVDRLDARADVYALGAMLYEVLAGRPPYQGSDAWAVLRQVMAGPPPPPGRGTGPSALVTFTFEPDPTPEESGGPTLPEELVTLCMDCLAREPADRPVDGVAVGEALRRWLDGAGQRAKALEVVAEAEALVPMVDALLRNAEALRAEGESLLSGLPSWAPEEDMTQGWATLDEAAQVERQATLLELKREALLRAALTHAPTLAEAHAALVQIERGRHAEAERSRDPQAATRAEVRLREHYEALPDHHPTRRSTATYLKGVGALTLLTDAPDAEVVLYRHELRHRRLVEVPVGSLGRTPLREVSLPRGSYLCRIRHPDRAEVRYPVHILRGEHWDGVPPGGSAPLPVRLPHVGELGPDDCLVPAGWFWSGGDPEARYDLPRRRLWCDELVVKRFPVTNRQ